MRTSRRTIAALAGVAGIALIASGCSTGGGGDDDGPVTLTLATFNDFGYTDELLAEFTDETGIKVVHNKAATSNDARANYFQKLGNTGLADVEAVEIDWFTEAMQYSDLLAPVPDDLKGESLWVFVVAAPGVDAGDELRAAISARVTAALGPSFKPAQVRFTRTLPKTRSAKVLRRAIRAVVTGDEPGDLSGLEDPASLDATAAAR